MAGLQKDISATLSARPKQADAEYFQNKVFKTPTGEVKVTPQMAKLVERYFLKNDYSDTDEHITEEYHEAKKAGTLAALPAELEPYKEQVFQLIDSVFSTAQLPEIEDDRRNKVNPLNANSKFSRSPQCRRFRGQSTEPRTKAAHAAKMSFARQDRSAPMTACVRRIRFLKDWAIQ